MSAGHALLSASGAQRWLNCTPSARLEENLPEEPSEYADEGTLAHKLAELKIRKKFLNLKTKDFNSLIKESKANPLYLPEMDTCTDEYLDYVTELSLSYKTSPYIITEKTLDLSAYVPEGFGTGDCLIIGGDTLHIVDYKHGKGVPVSAVNNPQMRLYALGAMHEYSIIYGLKKFVTHIFQPRLNNVSTETLTLDELLAWGAEIKPKADAAFAGLGNFNPGEHCRFCKAKVKCRARSEQHTALADFGFIKPPVLSTEEVGQILKQAEQISNWVSDLEKWALKETLSGVTVPGWKAVEGKSNRQITNVDAAFKKLIESGYDEAVLYKREPITLTAIEELTGKKMFNTLLSEYVIKPPGKPTLAPETDPREPIQIKTAQDDFKNIN